MVDKLRYNYLYKKRDIYYFSKQVPSDVRRHYKQKRIIQSLKTKSFSRAVIQRDALLHKLEQLWIKFRITDEITLKTPFSFPGEVADKSAPTLSDALNDYLKLKGNGKGEIFFRASKRVVADIIHQIGNYPIHKYSTTDASKFRDYLFERKLTSASVKRIFAIIRAIVNLAINEHGLGCKNAFAKTYIPNLNDSKVRLPIPSNIIFKIQKECLQMNDPNRWLIALLSDTGMRLSEALGLKIEDLHLEDTIPYVTIAPNSARKLKTKSSAREIPLVGASLWSAQQIRKHAENEFAFPHYVTHDYCHTNSASAALNKWLKSRVPEHCVVHSFRHSMRDRLRSVHCPSEMIDQIGGWSNQKIGNNYGLGFQFAAMLEYMSKLIDN